MKSYHKTQYTIVIVKPKTESYTGHSSAFFAKIISERAEQMWCEVISQKIKTFSKEEAELHYKHLSLLGFFPKMIEYMISGDSIIMLIKWEKAISKMDKLKREIRKNFGCHPGIFDWIYNDKPYRNILHASDSKSEAHKETRRYFGEFFEEK